VEYLVREIGRERVLFGSDCVMRDAAPQLGWAAWARLPLEDKRLVLGGNIARLLGVG
jgi:predicted TIM-barrel fold metal-dependent hydrolase